MTSSGSTIIDTSTSNVNNPASALVASSRPPIPLAPRLTMTASTAQQIHLTGNHATSSHSNTDGHHLVASSSSTSSSSHVRSRQLIHRASLSTATQALNVDTSPPSARFPAYLPRPSHGRWQGNLGRSSTLADTRGLRLSKSSTTLAHGPDDFIQSKRNAKAEAISKQERGNIVDERFEILSQFRPDADFPGDVLVRCAGSDFYVHKAVLYFASPFFQAVLDGDWKETHPSLHTLSDNEEAQERAQDAEGEEESPVHTYRTTLSEDEREVTYFKGATSPRASFHTAHFNFDNQESMSERDISLMADEALSDSSDEIHETLDSIKSRRERTKSLGDKGGGEVTGILKRLATPPPHQDNLDSDSDTGIKHESDPIEAHTALQTEERSRKKQNRRIVAIIDLSEEGASTFQEFLCLVYPNKFEVPHLRKACVTFLRAALAGRPIEAMALAERHGLEDVYREASRHVLENMPSWEPEELEILSSDTLLRLERRRTWFLERLLKLGLARPARDYECHAACPDRQNCARLLQERWRSQYANAFKFGPPQPSIIWRHLRELETGSASIVTTAPIMSACQSSSKAWVQLLFDRMYELPTHGMTHPKFLFIKLDPDNGPKPRPRPTEGGDMTLPN